MPTTVIDDILTVQTNVREFARAQRESLRDFEVQTYPGVTLGQKNMPVDAAGAYVPGGRYPLVASAHMTIVTAKVAGVERVAACTPPTNGRHSRGNDRRHAPGGGRRNLSARRNPGRRSHGSGYRDHRAGRPPRRPRNAYVAEAKRQLFGEVGIDLFAARLRYSSSPTVRGPFRRRGGPAVSQAEHGPDSPAVLVTTSEKVARAVMGHIELLLPGMPTRDFAAPAWRDFGEVRRCR